MERGVRNRERIARAVTARNLSFPPESETLGIRIEATERLIEANAERMEAIQKMTKRTP